MSLRAIPLIVLAFILYNVIVLFGSGPPEQILSVQILPKITMISGGQWVFTWGDALVLMVLILLFIELLKATYTSTASLVDHALSMLLFAACLVEFLVVPKAATSVFFNLVVATLIDVVAGYTIGIRTARRDLSIGDQ
jgi:hypothetical protein